MALDLSKFKKVQSTDSQYNIPTSGQSSIKAINTPQVTSLSPSQTDSQSTQDSNPQWMTGIAEALPTVGGVLGSIGGGLAAGIAATPETLGTATVPAALLGSSAGSASGQAIGEWFKELIEKKPVSSSEISKQAGIGGIYGLIPGGEELNLAAKIGTRVASGAVASGASQAISDIGTNKSSQEKISDVKRASEIGAVSFPVLGGLGDAGISAIKYLGEKIPGDLIQSAIEKPQQTAEAIFKSVQGMLVGHNNIDYAIEKGIIQKGTIQKTDSGIMAEGVGLTTDAINNAMDKSRELSNNVEKQLQEKLATVKTTFGLNDKSFLDGQSLFDFIQRAGTQVQSAIRGRALSQELYSVIPKEESASGKISATTINEMKRVLGDSYHIPGIPEVYNKLQTLVEKLSPESHDLNQEASRLIGIKSRLKEQGYAVSKKS